MMDKETYKRELVRMWDSIRDDEYKGTETCSGVNSCDECPLYSIGCGESFNAFEMIKAVEKWSNEQCNKEHQHQHEEYNVSEFEYKILYYAALDFGIGFEKFSDYEPLMSLLEDGYFCGANPDDKIADYLEMCEVEYGD